MKLNVTFLPHVKKKIETIKTEVSHLIANYQYGLALDKIDTLLAQQYIDENLIEQKLGCLLMLERWKEVETVAEQYIKVAPEEKKKTFLFYYVAGLYHLEQYELVVETIDEMYKNGDGHNYDNKEIEQLYKECKQKINEKAQQIEKRFQLAIVSKNELEQWQLVHRWIKLNVEPSPFIYYLLGSDDVHPIVKTNLLLALQERNIKTEVTIVKGQDKMIVSPAMLHPPKQDSVYKTTVKHLEAIEQQNPTLHTFSLQLLDSYVEYLYPFIYLQEESKAVANAALAIARDTLTGGKDSLHLKGKQEVYFKKAIERSYESFLRLTIL